MTSFIQLFESFKRLTLDERVYFVEMAMNHLSEARKQPEMVATGEAGDDAV